MMNLPVFVVRKRFYAVTRLDKYRPAAFALLNARRAAVVRGVANVPADAVNLIATIERVDFYPFEGTGSLCSLP
jgi:hypothetical protein